MKFFDRQNEVAGDVGGYLTRLEEQFGLIAKHQPLFEQTSNKGCRYKLNDNFFRFWFRFVFKHQYLVQVRMFDDTRRMEGERQTRPEVPQGVGLR